MQEVFLCSEIGCEYEMRVGYRCRYGDGDGQPGCQFGDEVRWFPHCASFSTSLSALFLSCEDEAGDARAPYLCEVRAREGLRRLLRWM